MNLQHNLGRFETRCLEEVRDQTPYSSPVNDHTLNAGGLTRKCSAAASAVGAGRGQTGAHARAPRGTPAGCSALSRRRARAASAAANMAETSEEVAVLVQRVVKDITNAFRRNPHM